MNTRICVGASVLLLAVGATFAEEGRKPIFEPVELLGAAAEGRFVLSRNIEQTTPGEPAIRLNGSVVSSTARAEIDLNGFKVIGVSGAAAIEVINMASVVIRNGAVSSPSTLHPAVWVNHNVADAEVILEDLKTSGGGDTIFIDVPKFVVRRCFVTESTLNGIKILGVDPFLAHGTIEDNVVTGTGTGVYAGIRIASSTNEGVIIRGNIIRANDFGAVIGDSTGLLVADNYFYGSGTFAPPRNALTVTDSNNCTIINNRATGDAAEGISLVNTDNCLIKDNVTSNNRYGIRLESGSNGNMLMGNLSNDNEAWGIHFDATSGDNRYGDNSATGNAGLAVCPVPGAGACINPDLCDEATGNVSFGTNLLPGGPC